MKKIYTYTRNNKMHTLLASIVAIAIIVLILPSSDEVEKATIGTHAKEVATVAVSDYSAGALGTAVAVSGTNTFVVRAESGGKVTRVLPSGSVVTAGTIIAELENAAQRAALTQAEGAYEGARAAASGVSAGSENTAQQAVTTWRNTTIAVAGAVRTTVDEQYVNPRNTNPGFRLQAFGEAPEFNKRRVAVEEIFIRWEKEITTLSSENVGAMLPTLLTDLRYINALVSNIAELIPRQTVAESFTEEQKAALVTRFQTIQTSLTSAIQSIEGARTSLRTSTESSTPTSNAAVKQALGIYQAAEATYNKTLIRAPFSGTIAAQNVAVGDIINIGNDIAIIVPRQGEVTEKSFTLPLSAVKFTPANALVFTIDEDSTLKAVPVTTGLITQSSITITGLTGTEAIVLDVRGLKAGEVVISNTAINN